MKIYSPSYKRPSDVTTQNYLSECIYVVSKSEAEAYEKEGHHVWVVPDSAQGSVCRIRNYILDHSGDRDILILDDDLKCIARWEKQKQKKLNEEQAMEFIEHGFDLANQLGVKQWGLNLLPDKGAYREYTPFAFTSVILGPFQGFCNMDLRYDENLPLKEDYDLSLQVLNEYRRTLRFNAYHYVCKQHTNRGGCAAYRTIEKEKAQLKLLQQKWGADIVREDKGKANVTRKKDVAYDINPIIKVPIKGV